MSKREYIIANRKWLEDKAKEEGVNALPNGIYYKVLKSGDPKGAQPQKRSIVTVHYTGWTIDGKKFDSSRGGTPIAMRLSDLIEGCGLLFACALAGANGRYPEEENLLNEKRTATPIIGCAARLLFFSWI